MWGFEQILTYYKVGDPFRMLIFRLQVQVVGGGAPKLAFFFFGAKSRLEKYDFDLFKGFSMEKKWTQIRQIPPPQ